MLFFVLKLVWHGLIVFHSHIFVLIQIRKCDRKKWFRSRQFSTKHCEKMRSYVMHCLLDIVHVRVMFNATFSRQKTFCLPLFRPFLLFCCFLSMYTTTCFDFAVISICKNLNSSRPYAFLLLSEKRKIVHTQTNTFTVGHKISKILYRPDQVIFDGWNSFSLNRKYTS